MSTPPQSPVLPAWAEELRNRYLSGESSQFLLHGNVRDVHAWDPGDGKLQYLDIRRFFEAFFSRTRDLVVYYNVSQGLQFPDKAQQLRFERLIDTSRALQGRERLGILPKNPTDAIPVIEELITNGAQTSGVLLDFFETICPSGDMAFMSTDDKANLVTLQRWSADPAFLSTDNLVVLVAAQVSEVNRKVASSPQLTSIAVPYPDQATRARFLAFCELGGVKLEITPEALAKVTAGLTLVQIRNLLRGAQQSGEAVTFRMVARRKKAIIEQECHGLVEFVDPSHNFSHVGGMDRVKADLMRVADAVKKGEKNRVPMGMIFVGPMGTGKTFVAEAFAAESGLTCLKLGSFRDKWVGSTEANLEKILDLVDALGYVLLIVDEADRSLAAGADSDGGTSSRVIARLKEFMSDTSHRGRVVILMMTNRPDKLDTDLKRPGRFDFKIPFFFPEEADDRRRVLEAQLRRMQLRVVEGLSLDHCVLKTAGFSAAEIESVLLLAANLAAEDGVDVIAQTHLDRASDDVVPSRDTRMLEYMEMLAVFETSAKRTLPLRYRDLSTEQVQARIDELRHLLGRRAAI